MENIDNGQFTNDIAPAPKRSNLLTTTCILTWICCTLLLVMTVWGLISNTPENQAERIEQMRQWNPEAADKMEAAMSEQGSVGQIVNNAIGLIAIGLCSLGAYMMWQLKKKGFYLYLAGEILPYIGMIVAGKQAMAAMSVGAPGVSGSTMAAVMIVLMLLFDAIFIIMYAVNLKHMTNNA
jgi:hypothetical protein